MMEKEREENDEGEKVKRTQKGENLQENRRGVERKRWEKKRREGKRRRGNESKGRKRMKGRRKTAVEKMKKGGEERKVEKTGEDDIERGGG